MSEPNPTHIIAGHHVRWWSKTQGHSYAWCWCGEEFASVEIHAEHVVSKLTDAGYSIVPSEHRAEARQWDGTRASIETLCRWANDEGDPMDDATLTYTYSRSDDVSDVDFAGPAGYKAVSVGDWIVRTANGEFLLARGELTAAAAEGEKP